MFITETHFAYNPYIDNQNLEINLRAHFSDLHNNLGEIRSFNIKRMLVAYSIKQVRIRIKGNHFIHISKVISIL